MSHQDPLLTPFTLKGLTLRNRIVSTSHEPAYSEDGLPKDRYREYHVEKAKGGVGLTQIGGSALVSPDSAPAFGNLQLWRDESVPWLRRLSDEVHEHGAAVMTQLTHMGHRTSNYTDNWLPAVGVSRVRESTHRAFTRPADRWDLARIARDYADTAARCKEGGLDGIEINAYSHLFDSFWTPLRNDRDDEYGGSFENRMRWPLEVIAAIREAVGDDYIVGVRMTFDEERPGGLTAEEGIRVARALTEAGIDFISVIKGYIDTDSELARMIPPMGTPSAPHLEFAGWVKRQLDVPVMHAARIADVATARYAIAEGLLDLVGMTRAMIADPHLVHKIAAGQTDQIRPCVGANMCIDGIYTSGASYCVHNPSTGRELQLPHQVSPAPVVKRCAVVGGGPAGLEAARTLAERGHQVTLFEASDRLGGQINLAAKSARRRDLIGIVDWRVEELRRLDVKIAVNHYVEAGELADAGYDVIIVATGGIPDVEVAKGSQLATDTWDVMSGAVKPTGEVIVYDDNGANPAVDAVEMLTGTARSIRYVSPDRTLLPELGTLTMTGYLEMLADNEVAITPVHRLLGIEKVEGRLKATFAVDGAHKTTDMVADTIVIEHGTVPVTDVYDDLVDGSINGGEIDLHDLLTLSPQSPHHNPDGRYQLYRVGDAVASRTIQTAVLDSFRLCSAI
ncbi:putative N-methylproline demethylase [Nostocoides japonicum T1-X7]|uniref:Putative N-methylproline demethylase n=1 Tax=Nostocoides japonicum T1-X7 TaxID=1194083 RepID=A0A077M381_9MICO|nr:NADH:flavin oxidoreductase [Tetrasphaera japonica]CCH80196.1 putative N-methylproline demethylase [Tetrasphaera japonica T1-X7]